MIQVRRARATGSTAPRRTTRTPAGRADRRFSTRARTTASIAALTALVLTALTAGRAVPVRPPSPHRVLYVIGDSWSAGLFADPDQTLAQDAARELGMTPAVDAQSGTGYLNAPSGTRTYEQRAAAIPAGRKADVVVLQGGSNDVGTSRSALGEAVGRTVAAVHRALPGAQVVLLGPGPDPWPVTAPQRAVDDALRREAAALHLAYLSPLREQWFTAATVGHIIDPQTDHPTVHGDAILGHLLAVDLRALGVGSAPQHDVAARGSR